MGNSSVTSKGIDMSDSGASPIYFKILTDNIGSIEYAKSTNSISLNNFRLLMSLLTWFTFSKTNTT